MIRMINYHRMMGMILLIAAVVVCPPAAYAMWATVGSTGTVDDADGSLAVFSGSTVTVAPAVSSGTLDIRYNVVPVGGLDTDGWFRLDVRFRDNGDSAQVIVSLKRQQWSSAGATTTLMTFDSNTRTASNNFQWSMTSYCLDGFDFPQYVYYFEVALKKYSSAGNPGLSGISLRFEGACP